VRAAAAATAPPAPVQHVFVIVLENEDFDSTFGPGSPAPYLAQTLTSQGQLLTQYHGIGHQSLDNYIAMVSGQAPNPQTQADCQIFTDFAPAPAVFDGNGQAIGTGCVFPANVPTLAGQLDAAGLTWRGYMEDMGTPCRHPTIGSTDPTQSAHVGDQYAARHNPFVYFHEIIDDAPSCAAHVVDLTQLTTDLQQTATTSNLSFITPNLCHDGHDEPCVDGQPGGLVSADAFLQQWVPLITAAPAFQDGGMLVVTYDEAEGDDPASSTACCGEQPGPNSPQPGVGGPGGGRTGAVILSPFTAAGSTNDTPYNHYALLRTIEDIFGLDHLGYAATGGLQPFGADVFNAGASTSTASTTSTSTTTTNGTTGSTLAHTGGGEWLQWIAALALLAAFVLTGARMTARRPR
jgi:hypothetical protein